MLYFLIFVSLFFEVFLLITYLEVREEVSFEAEHAGESLSHFPTTTIVVPFYNEAGTILGTVQSLLALDYPPEALSLLLVNDGSTDNTLEVLKEFEDHPQVRIISKENGGKYTALNLALEHIDTDLVGCLDADSFVNPDALRKIASYFEDLEVMAVVSSIKVHEPRTFLQHLQKTEYEWGVFLRRMLSHIGALYVTPGPFSIYRRQVFHNLGGFKHAHSTEDLELALRMQKNRYKIVNAHGAHVYTVTPPKLRSLVKQRVRWTYGFLNNAVDYRELFFNKRYGNLGVFFLPVASVSIITPLYMVGNLVWNTIREFVDALARYQIVGINWSLPSPSLDWYFINTGILPLITIATLFLTFILLYLALNLSGSRVKLSRGIVYFLTFYVFLVPLWVGKAVLNTLFRKQVTW